ncbi:MAG: sigma-70 family RNA polymerase sigma factor [Deltaproteobacteria bacterium]|nr:sigma-70 family RNA polymerase sigma factor [Candidatus Desulfobacula maris]
MDLQTIYDTYYDRMISYIRGKINDPHLTEDICQDVFLKIQSNLDKLNDETKLETWIFKIAKFTVIDFYRSKKSEPLPDLVKSDAQIEKNMAVAQGIDAINAIIDTLPDKYARVLKLFKLKELTAREIASETGLSLSAVKSRLLRGKAMLNEKLKTCCNVQYSADGSISDINCTDNYSRIIKQP